MSQSPPDAVHALVVDDDKAMQRILADALTQEGFWVTVERDGEWAVRTFEQKHFDLVLLDLMLPTLNGFEVARLIRAMPKGPDTPLVIISGAYKSPETKQQALEELGAFAFLEKPINFSQLLEVCRSALGERYPERTDPLAVPYREEELADVRARQESTEVEQLEARPSGERTREGDFGQTSFAELLAELHRAQSTGALLLKRDKVKKLVFFRAGVPLFVKSNLLSECLGRVMVKERMISEAQCAQSLERMKSSKRQQGTLLVEMGCISPHNLAYALNLQQRAKLLEVFHWESGRFRFDPSISLPGDTVGLDLTPAAAIYQGVRSAYDARRLKALLGRHGPEYAHRSTNPFFAFQDVGLSEEELSLLNAADGTRTLEELRGMGLLPALEADRLLYALICSGILEMHKEGRAVPTRSAAVDELELSSSELLDRDPPPLPSRPPPTRRAPAPVPAPALTPAPAPRAPGVQPHAGELLPEISYSGGLPMDEGEMRERLLAKMTELQRLDHFAALGVPMNAPVAVVKRAYYELLRQWHPDKHFGSASPEVRALAKQVYERLTAAHDTLASRDARDRYVQQLQADKPASRASPDLSRMMSAEQHFRKGLELLASRRFPEARLQLGEAVRLAPDEAEFRAHLGWALFKDGDDGAAALAELERAIALSPTQGRAYIFAGRIHKALHQLAAAEAQFERALQCDPGDREALDELSVLGWAKKHPRGGA